MNFNHNLNKQKKMEDYILYKKIDFQRGFIYVEKFTTVFHKIYKQHSLFKVLIHVDGSDVEMNFDDSIMINLLKNQRATIYRREDVEVLSSSITIN